MADFLDIVIFYMVVFTAMSYVFLMGATRYHNDGVIGKIRSSLIQMGLWIFDRIFPRILQDSFRNGLEHFLYTKNCYLQVLYCILLSAITYVFQTRIHPAIAEHHLPAAYVLGTSIAIGSNLVLFMACGYWDPGEITKDNLARYSGVYDFDGVMYVKGVRCRTCKFEKPARSKHCAFCNRCVHRFDHHCSWVNNCIGGKNIHLFITLLINISLASLYGAFVIANLLVAMVRSKGIMHASYLGRDGKLYPVTRLIALQHMFMQHPLIVLLMTSLFVLSILVGGFAAYHLYLAATNQTTNERYKKDPIKTPSPDTNNSQSGKTDCDDRTRTGDSVTHFLKRSRTASEESSVVSVKSNFYSRGILVNLCEVFFTSQVSRT